MDIKGITETSLMWFPAVVIRPSWYARYLQSDRMSMAAEPAQQEGRRSIRRIVVSALTAEILSIVHKDSVRFYRHILKRNIELSTRRWRLLLTGPSQSLNELLFISMVFFLSASLSLSLSQYTLYVALLFFTQCGEWTIEPFCPLN